MENLSQRTRSVLKNLDADKPEVFIAPSGVFRGLKFPACTNARYGDTYDRARAIWKYLRYSAMFSKRTVMRVIYDSGMNR